jgi:hypothetical protein
MGRLIATILLTLFLKSTYSISLNNSVGASFPENDVKVNVTNASCSNIGISNTKILELATASVDRFWNTVPTSRLRLERGSILTVTGDFQSAALCSSGINSSCTPNAALVHTNDIIISCNQNATNFPGATNVLALAVPNNISSGDIKGAVILLNDTASTGLVGKSDDEMMSIIAHEIGHAIGLGHSKFAKNLMHYESSSSRFYLSEDDVYGVTYLYPTNQPIGGCGSIDTSTPNNNNVIMLIAFLLMTGLFYLRKDRPLAKH